MQKSKNIVLILNGIYDTAIGKEMTMLKLI